MNTKILSLLFLLYLSFIYCSECTKKTTFEEGEDEYSACNFLSTDEYMCHYNEDKKVCEELTCENSPAKQCYNLPNATIDGIVKKCIRKSDNSGCEYKTCEEMTSDCGRFYDEDDDDKICTINSSGDKCEIKLCSEQTENCGNLIPYSYKKKCAMVSENKCGIIKKTCEEFDIWRCDKYSSDEGKPLTRCEYSQTENKCKEFTCEQLSKNECSKFDVDEDNKVCAPSGNNCAIHSCEDFDSTICETIEFSNPAYKCMNTDEGCKFKSIYEYNNLEDGEICEEFIPVNKAYKCIYNSYYKSCEIKAKECGELSKDECDLFNFKDNLDRTDGKKCVYSDDDGKCVLNSTSNSKNLEFCAYIFLILFLLF